MRRRGGRWDTPSVEYGRTKNESRIVSEDSKREKERKDTEAVHNQSCRLEA